MRISVFILFFVLILAQLVLSQNYKKDNMKWPILKHYDQAHLYHIAMPIGGIGTGTVSLSGRGELCDWEIMNRPAKKFSTGQTGTGTPFFSIWIKEPEKKPITRALMGPVELWEYQQAEGRPVNNHGLPRFREVSFEAAYPFGQVNFSDEELPVKVKLKAFNPFIPADADASGIPVALLTYEVTNLSKQSLTVSLCGLMRNFIGMDGFNQQRDWKGDYFPVGAKENKNIFKKGDGFQGIYMYSDGVDKKNEQWGTIALTTNSSEGVSYRTSSVPDDWSNAILDFWDDFSTDGELTEKSKQVDINPQSSLAVKFEILAGQTKSVRFFITWHFPNRFGWSRSIVGNYYATRYSDAWNVMEKTLPIINDLEEKTINWVTTFCESDLPDEIKEAALFNLSTLRSQTVFRTPDGFLYGWEGTMDNSGCCAGSCTHVWNYENATPFLFGDLAKGMREVEFGHAMKENGLICFRVGLPIKDANTSGRAAADGQMGTIMRMYREWLLSGDMEFLKKLYPSVKKALSFAWIEGGWDGNMDGVMEGCQHNTMDVEYFGPNPQMQIWYLGALRAGEEMAKAMKDESFANLTRSLFEKGSQWCDKNLFNGEYYIQIIQPIANLKMIAPGISVTGSVYPTDPPYQLGNGCLVDQLVGQYQAHVLGLGYLIKPENAKKTLQSIIKYNQKKSMFDHFNNMRSYVLGDEKALLMASFPKDRPKIPFPYFSEVMTGFEYAAAIGMLYEEMIDEGITTIGNIRNRYDGLKRSPFDEAECGHHYARAMASWAAPVALTGFGYNGTTKTLYFAKKNGKYFWSNGYAYGSLIQTSKGLDQILEVKVLGGKLELNEIVIRGFGKLSINPSKLLNEGQSFSIQISNNDPSVGKDTSIKFTGMNTVIQPPIIKTVKGNPLIHDVFSDKLDVTIESDNPKNKIFYTIDGSEPTNKSLLYTSPLRIENSAILKAISSDGENISFRSVKATFIKAKQVKSILLKNQPNKKYSANGELSLLDGDFGSELFTDGKWLGFEGDDFEAVIDFGTKRSIKNIGLRCLNNQGSWIFLPTEIKFFVSDDGKTYREIAIMNKSEIDKFKNELTPTLQKSLKGIRYQYLKVFAKNIGTCPPDHPGAGGKSWLFIDEIILE